MGSSNTNTQGTGNKGTGVPIVSAEAMREMLEMRIVSLADVESVLVAMIDSGTLEEEQGRHIMQALFAMWDTGTEEA